MIEAPDSALQHLWQKGADHHEHRAHVEGEGRVPVERLGVEDRAVMDKAGAVEQHVERPELGGQCRDRVVLGHVEPAGRDQRVGERGELVLGDVGRQHARPLGGKGQRRRPADPLRRRRHQCALAREPSRHRAESATPARPL